MATEPQGGTRPPAAPAAPAAPASPAAPAAPASPAPGPLLTELASAVGSEREARWILEEAHSRSLQSLQPLPGEPAGAERLALAMASRRAAGEPLQHVLGHWSFRHLEVKVDGRALVPRPETEIVAGIAIDETRRLLDEGRPSATIADLGTGTGVIACSLASELPAGRSLAIYATDASAEALTLAQENAATLDAASRDRLRFRLGSWFDALPREIAGRIDLIVSNPPYLAASEWEDLADVVRDYDPHGALVSGPTGMEAIEHLVEGAPAWLATHGILLLEIAPHESSASLELVAQAGFSDYEVRPDLAGRARVLVARR
ncbi:MAG: peptide chain release factor N(5)-glutamine methyltransferase [Acidimicrobiales bacterium]